MTAALAAAILSPEWGIFERVCAVSGVDPFEVFTDDVVRFQARFARLFRPADEPETDAKPEGDAEQAWAAAGEANRRAWLAGT